MRMLLVAGAFAAAAWPGAPLHAQSYPVKPVRYVVAFAAGDSPDIVARLVADRLTRLWDQQVVVENRVGAGGTIAGAAVANAAPDGYTLFHCNIASSAIAAAVYPKLPYEPIRDFAMVSRIATTANALLPHIVSGKVRGLAVTSAQRSAKLPAVPTMLESGIADYVVTSWYGMCAPAGTPPPILDKLHADLTKTLQAPDVQQRLADLVIDVAPTSRDEFTAFIRSEMVRWAKVVKDAGIPPQ